MNLRIKGLSLNQWWNSSKNNSKN